MTLIAAPGKKPVPVIVIFVGVAASNELGLTEVIVGTTVGFVMTKGMGVDGPPPGVGFVTVTWTVPGVAISAVEIVVKPLWGLLSVVVLLTPLKVIAAPGAKLAPLTPNKKGKVPATTVVGPMAVNVGTG